jgi:hypothetical protein
MDYITVGCKVSFDAEYISDNTITFTYEGIPFVVYFRRLYDELTDQELKELNFHVTENRTICSVYDLKDYYGRIGQFAILLAEGTQEDSDARTTRIKGELHNPDLKLTAPSNIFKKFIKHMAIINIDELKKLYPEDYESFWSDAGVVSESNKVKIIHDKKEELFPSSGGRRKNGRRCRRTRQKTKRVKRAKLMKRSRKANHIKNVKH